MALLSGSAPHTSPRALMRSFLPRALALPQFCGRTPGAPEISMNSSEALQVCSSKRPYLAIESRNHGPRAHD
jgi:hypothetical protein